ncbi:MAG: acetoacetate decarboxylase family protein [Candidatus Heimdallarchaeota archaeon]|nr:acetoacetate decarboxylase family protein [Candidatus Heimdallarchaeota archaeon]MBY8993113.1 acetoacetate decarboxylase family protein [Candidatus Heimdallarchaeota archaeon]
MISEKEAAIIYDAEAINIVYETKPEIVERLLPPPLEPFDTPMVRVYIANFPRTNFGISYKEGALFLFCKYKGEIGVYTLSMPVDNDIAMVLGRDIAGYPKKVGNIHLEKKGKNVHGCVERNGVRFVDIKAKTGIKIPEKQAIKFGLGPNKSVGTAFNFKHFPAPDVTGFDYKPRLTRNPVGVERKTLLNANATIEFQPSEDDPWHEVEVVKMVGAFYTVQTTSMLKGEVVAEVDHESFVPYSFLKWDKENL